MSIIKTLDYGSYNNPISKMMLEHNIQLKKEIINEIRQETVDRIKNELKKELYDEIFTKLKCELQLEIYNEVYEKIKKITEDSFVQLSMEEK